VWIGSDPHMTDVFSMGSWQPGEGQGEQFVQAWTAFARWAASMDGCAAPPRLTRDLADEGRFVSFAAWRDPESMRAWKAHPEFRERMSQVQQHVEKFAASELELVVDVAPLSGPA
jgi:heme-degrading monooxygenase HmoA